MRGPKSYLLLLTVFFSAEFLAQHLALPNRDKQHPSFVNSKDIFGTRNFIENKGQFDTVLPEQKILYVYDHGGEKVYFTTRGLVYEHYKAPHITHEMKEEIERGRMREPFGTLAHIGMTWAGANPEPEVQASGRQSHYITYGGAELNSATYKKLLYRNVYDNIDVEFTIPADKSSGFKYNVIIRPGGRLSDLRMQYSGDIKKMRLQKNGNVVIASEFGEITEHVPLTFCAGQELPSFFRLENRDLTFEIPGAQDCVGELVIDPWVTAITTLSNNDYGFDVDYDFSGYIYVYGGGNSNQPGKFKVARYDPTGTLLWTFSGTIASVGWNTGASWTSNFKVNKGSKKTYVAKNQGAPLVVRIDSMGNYDNWIVPQSPTILEVWNMDLSCGGDLVIYGGGATSGELVTQSTATVVQITNFTTGVTGCCQDVVSYAVDLLGNNYVYMLGHAQITNQILQVMPGFSTSAWSAPGGLSMQYLANKNNYTGANAGSAVAFNALAVNLNYLFGYDGQTLLAYNKSNGSILGTLSIPNVTTPRRVGGITVDECNNVYVGGTGDILAYHFTGSNFTPLSPISLSLTSTNQFVYDVVYSQYTNKLYVSGSGFVGQLDAIYSNTCSPITTSNQCSFGQFGVTALSNSITCATLGAATVQATGGFGPFTYTWLPGLQTGSVATGLSPGTYTILVTDNFLNTSFSTTVHFDPLVPLTATLSASLKQQCFGFATATAAIVGIAGGSGQQSYLWKKGPVTYTTASVTGLTNGTWSVTVTDSLTGCTFNSDFVITEPPPLTLNVAAGSPSACTGNSVNLSALAGGGTMPLSYLWSNGVTSPGNLASGGPGLQVFTVTVTDFNGCVITRSLQVDFLPLPGLSVSSVSICPLETATLNASGASSYTWNGTQTGPTFTASPLSTTVYTVAGTGTVCMATLPVTVVVKPLPNLQVTGNSPVCEGKQLNMQASGGQLYQWTGPQTYTSVLPNAILNAPSAAASGVYQVTVTAANSCTAQSAYTAVVNPTPAISVAGSTVCEGSDIHLQVNTSLSPGSFQWSGPLGFLSAQQNPQLGNSAVANSGAYSVIVTAPTSCTSAAIAHVTVSAMPSYTISGNSPLCENDQLKLNAAGTPAGSFFNWSGPQNFSSQLAAPVLASAPVGAGGIYSLSVVNGSCLQSLTYPVTVHALPQISVNGNASVCETKTLTLSAGSNKSINIWSWKAFNFASTSPQFSRGPATQAIAGVYSVSAFDSDGCSSTTTVHVQVLLNPVISAANPTVCLFAPATFSASGAATYTWSGPMLYAVGNPATLSAASNTAVSVYSVLAQGSNGCESATVVTLHTLPLPSPVISFKPSAEICSGQTVTLSGSGAQAYEWKSASGLFYEGAELHLPAHAGLNGQFTLTGTDAKGCRGMVSKVLLVKKLPVGQLQGEMEGCVPLCTRLEFVSTDSAVTALWKIGADKIGSPKFDYCFRTTGTHTLDGRLFSAATSCSVAINYQVNVYPKPHADFEFHPEHPTEELDLVYFKNTSTGENLSAWEWHFGDVIPQKFNTRDSRYIFRTPGVYPVVLVAADMHDCRDTVLKKITVETDFTMYVPDVFTPNADSRNEVFLPVLRGVKMYHLQIFNRWGEKLFETTDPNEGWDGFFRGELCKPETYTWLIDLTTTGGVVKNKSGTVLLLR